VETYQRTACGRIKEGDKYKRYEYRDVLLTLDTCNRPSDTAALEHALCLIDVI
jgi:hypothetical protein